MWREEKWKKIIGKIFFYWLGCAIIPHCAYLVSSPCIMHTSLPARRLRDSCHCCNRCVVLRSLRWGKKTHIHCSEDLLTVIIAFEVRQFTTKASSQSRDCQASHRKSIAWLLLLTGRCENTIQGGKTREIVYIHNKTKCKLSHTIE